MIFPRNVEVGENDGISYEIISGLNEGVEVITSMAQEKETTASTGTARSPFMPQRPRGGAPRP
jgi:hypothetical protein